MTSNSFKKISNVPDLNGYILLEEIGEGGFGAVYKAEQISTGQLVAIKTLKLKEYPDPHRKKQHIARFEREARICAEINHPHIVRLLDKGSSDADEPFVVFEYILGQTLKDLILQTGGLPVPEVAELMGQVLDALICAHAKGIVHRDLKPHNIMVTKTGSKSHVKVLDFGIGAFTNDVRNADTKNLTLTQEVLGTPMYCAPEQLRGEPPTVKSDLYAWGLILIECLTGEPAMQGNSIAEIFQQQLNNSNVPLPPSISDHPLADLLRRVLNKNTQLRAGEASYVFDEYLKINFNNLVGKIQTTHFSLLSSPEGITRINHLEWNRANGAKKQITVLSVKLSLLFSKEANLDIETLDAIQKDQLNLCKDTAIRFGGTIAGALADNLLIYFGYPRVSDNDARRAGRTALELIGQVQRRSALFYEQHSLKLAIRIGINSGTVLSHQHHLPEGMVPNSAFNLLYCAEPGKAMVTEITKKLLEPYIEFEPALQLALYNIEQSVQLYNLIGERQTEAFSFLRPGNADRKMVGREVEQMRIHNLWRTTTITNGNTVFITGQAGIGKSKLVHECKKKIRKGKFTIIECRCLPEHQNNALYVFLEMIKRCIRLHDQIDEEIVKEKLKAALKNANISSKQVMPVLCSWLNISLQNNYKGALLVGSKQKELIFAALRKLIMSLNQEGKFLLVIEDLHWIDPTSLELLNELIGSIDQANYFLLMTARPEFQSQWPSHIVNRIELITLTKSATRKMIQSVLNQKSIHERALSYIAEKADGIPLFIEELTGMLLEKKYLILVEGEYQLLENIEEKSLPVTLNDMLNARLDKLGLAKETAQIAATIGREFSYDLLVKSSFRDEAAVQADLNELLNADLIYQQRRVQNDHYFFRHALIRDAAYDGMVRQQKIEAHRSVANSIEIFFTEMKNKHPGMLAAHWAEAGEYDMASKYAYQATAISLKKSLYKECINHANQGIGWAQKMTAMPLKIERELQINQYLIQALIAIKGFAHEEVEIANDRSEQLSLLLPDSSTWLLTIMWNRIQFNLMSSNYSKYELLWAKAIKDAETLKHLPFLTALHGLNGYKCWMFAQYDKAEAELLTSFKINASIDDKIALKMFGLDFKIYSYIILANVYAFKSEFVKSEEAITLGMTLANKLNDGLTKAYALVMCISLYFYRNELERIQQIYQEYVQFLKDHNFTSFLYLFELLEGLISNNPEKANANLLLLHATGIKTPDTYYTLIAAQTEFNSGQYTASLEKLERLIDYAIESKEKFQLPDLYRLKALCLSKIGTANEVEENFSMALKAADDSKALLYKMRVLIDYHNTTSKKAIKENCKSELKLLLFEVETLPEVKEYMLIQNILKE
jgi:TOMM system kinase/cyclase fusion protein